MNVLFVGTHGIGRCQMAASIYNTLVLDGHADAAGIRVPEKERGQTLGERAKTHADVWNVLAAMNEIGVDLWHRPRRKITKAMLDDYDVIVVIAATDTLPKYLHDHPKAVYWGVPQSPFDGVDAARDVRDEIKRMVVAFLQTARA